MARAKKEAALTPEECLQAALVPDWEWPYKLPENWCWVKASAVARIYTGNSISEKIKADKYAGQQEGLLFIATKDIGFDNAINYETDIRIPDYPNFKIAPANTALLCIEGGSAGRKVGFVNREVCFGNKLCVFAAEKVNSKFIYYILQSQYFIQQFNNRKHGLIGGVSVNDLAEIGFPLSPLAEQQRIVDRIESLFAKLDEAKEKAQAVVDSFETRKAAILHKAFTGELTAKWREEHGVRMESWEHHQFSDLCAIVRGGSPRPAGDPRYYDGNIPFMKVADITRNDSPYVSKVEYSIKEEGLKKTRMVEANTLLLTNSGATLGVPAITTILSSGFEIFFEKSPKRIAVRKVNQATSASCKAIASFAIRAFTSSSCVCFAFSAGIALTTKIVPPILSTKPVFISSTVITSLRKNRGVRFRTPRYQPKKDYSFS